MRVLGYLFVGITVRKRTFLFAYEQDDVPKEL